MKRTWLKLIFWSGILYLSAFNLALAQVDPGIRDTCSLSWFETVPPNSTVVMNVYVFNDEALGLIDIPLVFGDSSKYPDIRCDSVSFVGTRGASSIIHSDTFDIDNSKYRLDVWALWYVPGSYLAPGRGAVAKIYFTTGPFWNSCCYHWVDTTFFPPGNDLMFVDVLGLTSWVPVFVKGCLEVQDVNTPAKPGVFSLAQNYPNPFNPKTMIRFALPKDSWVKLEVYNILGQKVKILVDEKLEAGVKEVEWDGKDSKGLEVASGIYFYKIKAYDFSDVKKMVMLK